MTEPTEPTEPTLIPQWPDLRKLVGKVLHWQSRETTAEIAVQAAQARRDEARARREMAEADVAIEKARVIRARATSRWGPAADEHLAEYVVSDE
jgi:hypothetical protein